MNDRTTRGWPAPAASANTRVPLGCAPRPAATCAALLGAALAACAWAPPLRAADEIQVYNSEINEMGEWSLELHANYAVKGRTLPEAPGGFAPDRALQGTPELALGVTDWWEVGAYLPFAVTRQGEALAGGVKLRSLFVAPHAKQRRWLFGLNFELGYMNPAFAAERWNLEVRPIVGFRAGGFEAILNPNLQLALSGSDNRPDLEPGARVAYTVSGPWTVGLEHYAGLGPVDRLYPAAEQAHTTFAVVEYSGAGWDLHLGLGHGWSDAADETVVKTIAKLPL